MRFTLAVFVLCTGSVEAASFPLGVFMSAPSQVSASLAPGTPGTPLGSAVGASSINWTWSAASSAIGYNIYQASSPSTLIAQLPGTSYTEVGLATNTADGIIVTATNTYGTTSSSPNTVYTLADSSITLSITAVYSSSVSLSWSAGSNPAGTYYDLEDSSTLSYSSISSAAVVSYTATSLSASTSYSFKVRAINGNGFYTAFTNVVTTTTLAPPTDPLDISLVPSVSVANVPTANATAAGISVWTTDENQKVMQNTGSATLQKSATSFAMPNEYAQIQVHIQAGAAGISNLNWSMPNFVNNQNSFQISTDCASIQVDRASYNYVSKATITAMTGNTYIGTWSDYPQGLIYTRDPYFRQTTNAFPYTVQPNKNQSIWIDAHIPSNAPSGFYYSYLSITSGTSPTVLIASVPITIAVLDTAMMPSTSSLPTMFGTGDNPMGYAMNGTWFGVESYSDCSGLGSDVCTTMADADIATQLLDHRISVPYSYPGMYNGDFLGVDDSLIYYRALLNGSGTHVPQILSGAKLTLFQYESIGSPGYGTAGATDWTSYMASHGWPTVSEDYTIDEPSGSGFATFVTKAGQMNAAVPLMRALVTSDWASLSGHSATNFQGFMVPIQEELWTVGGGSQRSSYSAWLAGSTQNVVGSYVSCESAGTCTNGTVGPAGGDGNSNENVDGMPVANRTMPWMMWIATTTMWLHYDIDYCWDNTDCGGAAYVNNGVAIATKTWRAGGQYYAGGVGDGDIILPGTPTTVGVSTPIAIPTVVEELNLAGLQDYEYLVRVNTFNPGLTWVAAQSFITNPHTFNTSPTSNGAYAGNIVSAKRMLAKALHQRTHLGSTCPFFQ